VKRVVACGYGMRLNTPNQPPPPADNPRPLLPWQRVGNEKHSYSHLRDAKENENGSHSHLRS